MCSSDLPNLAEVRCLLNAIAGDLDPQVRHLPQEPNRKALGKNNALSRLRRGMDQEALTLLLAQTL